jgi:hypothetical protein
MNVNSVETTKGSKMRLINEEEAGTDQMVKDLEKAYFHSCKHNKTKVDDLKYFRQYVWNLFAMMSQALDTVKQTQDEETGSVKKCESCLEHFLESKLTKVDAHALVCDECRESESDYETSR